MNLNTFLAGLGATLAQKAESVGATLLAAEGQVALTFANDERATLVDVKQHMVTTFTARRAAGDDIVTAAKTAAADAGSTFVTDEKADFGKAISGTISVFEYALTQLEDVAEGAAVVQVGG